jgi:hypothetical protein
MDILDKDIARLQAMVRSAHQDFDQTVAFHEAWRPTAFDEALHARMGTSFATQTFKVIRVALRREVLLGLVRLWDTRSDTLKMEFVAAQLRRSAVLDALAGDRADKTALPIVDPMRRELGRIASEALTIIEKYSKDGERHAVLEVVRKLRHTRLAHREAVSELSAASAIVPDASAEEIEELYQDSANLVRLLLKVAVGHAYDPREAAGVFSQYAQAFWASVRGERTEGHPNYARKLSSRDIEG